MPPVFRDDLPPPPPAVRRPVSDERHGQTRTDDYAWLRAPNWQEMFKDTSLLDPAIRAHLDAENTYARAVMGDLDGLKADLIAEMRGASRRTTRPCRRRTEPMPTAYPIGTAPSIRASCAARAKAATKL